ncbi:MAG: PIN domain-containing protein, partial [Candidatus Scalindua sediminis]
MKIILDTNIFVEDFLMKSIKFSNLFDFLKKTNSEIVIFQIVFQEVIALYRRKLIEKLDKYYKSKEELLKIFNNKPF